MFKSGAVLALVVVGFLAGVAIASGPPPMEPTDEAWMKDSAFQNPRKDFAWLARISNQLGNIGTKLDAIAAKLPTSTSTDWTCKEVNGAAGVQSAARNSRELVLSGMSAAAGAVIVCTR